jgi:hypothetical protein
MINPVECWTQKHGYTYSGCNRWNSVDIKLVWKRRYMKFIDRHTIAHITATYVARLGLYVLSIVLSHAFNCIDRPVRRLHTRLRQGKGKCIVSAVASDQSCYVEWYLLKLQRSYIASTSAGSDRFY